MKKLSLLFIPVAAAFSAALFVSSCVEPVDNGNNEEEEIEIEKTRLPAPVLEVTDMTPGSFTVSWTAVEGADSYDYQCGWQDGEILSTVGTELIFDGLEVGAEYSLFVKSMPSDTMVFSESDWAEVSVTIGNMYSDENMFSIDMVDMADVRTVVYKITPKEPEMLFFREAFEDIAWEELGAEPEAVWTAALENYKNIFGSSTLDMIAEKGVVESQFEYVYNQHTYILVAGIDEELNRITSVVDTVFYSGEVPPSDITFTVEVPEIGTSSAVVKVIPSNNDPYSMLLMESSALEGYTMEEIEEYVIKQNYGEYINSGHVYNGELTMTYHEGQLDPDTEYTILVFGWNTTLNTDVTVETFRTEDATSSSGLTFEWLVEILGPTQLHVVVTPSDPDALYIVIPMPEYDYVEFVDENGVVAIDEYIDYVCMGMISPVEYAMMFAKTGVTDRIFDDWNDGLYPGESYMLMAVGVDLDETAWTVEFYDAQLYEEMITMPEE